jgi:hypothetical protein
VKFGAQRVGQFEIPSARRDPTLRSGTQTADPSLRGGGLFVAATVNWGPPPPPPLQTTRLVNYCRIPVAAVGAHSGHLRHEPVHSAVSSPPVQQGRSEKECNFCQSVNWMCGLFNDNFSSPDNVGWTNRRQCGRKRSWPNLRYYPDICLEELRRTTRTLATRKPVEIWAGWIPNKSLEPAWCYWMDGRGSLPGTKKSTPTQLARAKSTVRPHISVGVEVLPPLPLYAFMIWSCAVVCG